MIISTNTLNYLLALYIKKIKVYSALITYTCVYLKKIFKTIAADKHLNFNDLKISRLEVSDDIQKCINSFNELNVDRNKLNYLNGWQVLSKDGTEFELHLNSIYTTYGVEFTAQVHKALIDYGHTQKKRSLQTYVIYIKAFFLKRWF